MTENTITISVEEYKDLLKKAERIATFERIFAVNEFIATNDVAHILGIRSEENACV